MANDVTVKPVETSKEAVAYNLFLSVAMAEGAVINSIGGTPVVTGGMTKKEILRAYLDSLYTVKIANGISEHIEKMPA